MVMSAYNKVGGRSAVRIGDLLMGILKEEWGFEGVVVSDWFGTYSEAAMEAGLDLEMPGPASFLGSHLVDAVGDGTVREEESGRCRRSHGASAPRARLPSTWRDELHPRAGRTGASGRRSGHRIAEERVLRAAYRAVSHHAGARDRTGRRPTVPTRWWRIRSHATLRALAARNHNRSRRKSQVTYHPGCVIPGPVLPLGPSGLRTEDGEGRNCG